METYKYEYKYKYTSGPRRSSKNKQKHLDHLADGGVRVVVDELVVAQYAADAVVADARHVARQAVRRYQPRHSAMQCIQCTCKVS